MSVLFTNNASAQLASGISGASVTIVVAAGQGARFPVPGTGSYFYATLVDQGNNLEVVKCTARSNDSLTVVRGQDGTSPRSYVAGDLIELRPVAAAFEDIQAFVPSGNIGAATIAGAIEELDQEKAGLALNNTFTGDNTFSGNNTFSGVTRLGADWTVEQSGSSLIFKYQSVAKFALKFTGELVAVGDVVTDGTI
jgi:hypothetical protein